MNVIQTRSQSIPVSQEVPQYLFKKSLESRKQSGEGVLDGQSVDEQSWEETGYCSPEKAWGR